MDNQNIVKIIDSQTTAGYCLTKSYAKILLNNFKEGLELLSINQNQSNKYAIDIYWKKLQPEYNWFCIIPKIGRQIASYSDIEKRIVNYQS